MNNERIELQLRFYNDGVYPPQHGEGCLFKLCTKDKKQVWVLEKSPDGQWNDEGEAYTHVYQRYYMLTEFPNDKTQHAMAEKLMNEDWFDYDEFLINQARFSKHHGGTDNDTISVMTLVVEPAAYKLPNQHFYIEKGRIYAQDDETGIIRELERVICRNKETKEPLFSFYVLSQKGVWYPGSTANLIAAQDCKMPQLWRSQWPRLVHDPENEIVQEDVFVVEQETIWD